MFGTRPLIERVHARLYPEDRPVNSFDAPPSIPPFFAQPPMPPNFGPRMNPVDAMLASPPSPPPTIEEALRVVSAAVVDVMDETNQDYWTFREFEAELLARIAAKRDAKKAELHKQIAATIIEGRAARAKVGSLEAEHNAALMGWNLQESLFSQANVRLNSLLASDPAMHDEFAGTEEIAQWRASIKPAEQAADEAAKASSQALQTMHMLEEKIVAAKRELSAIRDQLRGLREQL